MSQDNLSETSENSFLQTRFFQKFVQHLHVHHLNTTNGLTYPFPMFVTTRSNLMSVCSVTGPMLSARPAKNATLCIGRLLAPEINKNIVICNKLTKNLILWRHGDGILRPEPVERALTYLEMLYRTCKFTFGVHL